MPQRLGDNRHMPTATNATLLHHDCPLAYTITGEGIPVVLIQGVGVHGNGWLPQVEALARSWRCLTFDNRGMGKSLPIGAPVTVEQMTEDTLAIMDAAGMTSAQIVGHSLGGLVALHLALTARDRARSLALLCTFANGRVATRMTPRMFWLGIVMSSIPSIRTRTACPPSSWEL